MARHWGHRNTTAVPHIVTSPGAMSVVHRWSVRFALSLEVMHSLGQYNYRYFVLLLL